MPSPPGRFSTTTGWPQRADSLSAISRAPISTPLPGPRVTMNRTGRIGHVSAAPQPPDHSARVAAIKADRAQRAFIALLIVPPWTGRSFHRAGRCGASIEITPDEASLFVDISTSRDAMPQLWAVPRKCRVRKRRFTCATGSELPMPTFLLSPLVKWSLAAMGGAMIVHWAVKEARRINEELEQARRGEAKITDAEPPPTLRRDPAARQYRL